jgi:hypothetical protein
MLTIEEFLSLKNAYLSTKSDDWEYESHGPEKEQAREHLDDFQKFLFPELYPKDKPKEVLSPHRFEDMLMQLFFGAPSPQTRAYVALHTSQPFDLMQACNDACNRIGLHLADAAQKAHAEIKASFAAAHIRLNAFSAIPVDQYDVDPATGHVRSYLDKRGVRWHVYYLQDGRPDYERNVANQVREYCYDEKGHFTKVILNNALSPLTT